MIKVSEVIEGKTYRTSVAVWTVERIDNTTMVHVRRDDGRTARFDLSSFARWIVCQVD